jgi:peptidoglycan/xylan/chitin deacetylase (PgdA/CDA1 family)
MLRKAKLGLLIAAGRTGLIRLIAASPWRRARLLILCYHGIARYDEFEATPVYMSASKFRHRMEMLRASRATVLPLDEGVRRLSEGTLPPRAVSVTFDDGMYDFYASAFPVLESFGFPVTLYLTTYYVDYPRPVFDLMCSYLLWKGRGYGGLHMPDVLPDRVALDTAAGRAEAYSLIKAYVSSRKLSAREKDTLLESVARAMEIDYGDLCRKRVLCLVGPEEVRDLVRRGLDVQYHTHRHRVYRRGDLILQDLDDNRRRIKALTGVEPKHFCYPGGFYTPEYIEQLRGLEIVSATTCKPGLCTRTGDPLLLPRFVDSENVTDVEFSAWLDGVAALLPERPYVVEASYHLGSDEPFTQRPATSA